MVQPKSKKSAHRNWLSNLARSKSGNSMMLVAAALVPIAGVIGAGFDLGRAYLTKTKLQAACDAGALAGRRVMAGTTWGATSIAAANAYFSVNFVNGKYGTTGLFKSFTSTDGETVLGAANVQVPTSLMKIFGYSVMPVNVQCDAVMNLPNTDVMFVLDTTRSMNEINAGDTDPKIVGLRGAITGFYNTVEAAKSASTQVRYGFVPYSSTVNVGYLLRPEWMVDNWTYQSRIPDGTGTSSSAAQTNVNQSTNSNWTMMSGPSSRTHTYSSLPLEACNAPAEAMTWGPTTVISGPTTSANPASKTGNQIVRVLQYTADGRRYSVTKTASTCTLDTEIFNGYIERYTETTIVVDVGASSSALIYWKYLPVTYNVSALKGITSGGTVTAPIGANHASRTVNWQGCIEERGTVRATSYSPIPAGALDMNIDLLPTNGVPNTQWRPSLPELVFARTGVTSGWSVAEIPTAADPKTNADYPNIGDQNPLDNISACPTQSRKLSAITSGDLATYLGSLTPAGNTYHDIGLVWGARLMSPTGLFASENAATPTGGQITRHMIFMTDGSIDTYPYVYDAYGWPALDRRRVMDPSVDPTKADQDTLVASRTEAMCTAIKAKGITVWVIAFGTSLSSLLSDCASTTGHAFQANNTAALNTTFSDIASRIANLRIKR